jgi:lipopolysaccharide biosynthesis glycosyltransferase
MDERDPQAFVHSDGAVTTRDSVVVVCATDAQYVTPLAVMLRSALDNLADDRRMIVYVLHSDVSENDRRRVVESIPRDRCTIAWIPIDASQVAGVPVWGRMPVSTYFKLLLPDVLDANVSRAIWLDCDLLVTADISELWDTQLNGMPVAAVQDQLVPLASSKGGIASRAEVEIPDGSRYFNAGVMIVDVDQWRADGVSKRALDHLTRRWKSVVFWDQEGLNVALAGKWAQLPQKWNWNVSLPRNRIRSGNSLPAILHFAGMLKPWLYRTRDPVWSLYMRYLDRTSWARVRPARSVGATAISIYERSGIRSLVYPLESIVLEVIRRLSRNPAKGSRSTFSSALQTGNQ